MIGRIYVSLHVLTKHLEQVSFNVILKYQLNVLLAHCEG